MINLRNNLTYYNFRYILRRFSTKYRYSIFLIFISFLFIFCSEEKSQYPYVRMVDRLVGEGDTAGWGSDLGVIFRYNGKIYTLGGDTLYNNIFVSNIIGSTTDQNSSDGLDIVWQKKDGGPKQFFAPIDATTIVPAGAISVNGTIYVFMMSVISWIDENHPEYSGRPALVKSTDDGDTFSLVWAGDVGRMINIAPVISTHPENSNKEALYLIASNQYRDSEIYLAYTDLDKIEDRGSYKYYIGMDGGRPKWSDKIGEAVPIVNDVKVGELSVQWNKYLNKWLLCYFDYTPSGGNADMFFRTADNLWGPWSDAVFVYDGDYRYYWYETEETRQGPKLWGTPYGGYILSDTEGSKVYFTLSLWMPYSIFLMEVDLKELF